LAGGDGHVPRRGGRGILRRQLARTLLRQAQRVVQRQRGRVRLHGTKAQQHCKGGWAERRAARTGAQGSAAN
jgi:hypothetical protein